MLLEIRSFQKHAVFLGYHVRGGGGGGGVISGILRYMYLQNLQYN